MTSTRLCSNYEPEHRVTCDLPEGHKGEHKATLYWGSEGKLELKVGYLDEE